VNISFWVKQFFSEHFRVSPRQRKNVSEVADFLKEHLTIKYAPSRSTGIRQVEPPYVLNSLSAC